MKVGSGAKKTILKATNRNQALEALESGPTTTRCYGQSPSRACSLKHSLQMSILRSLQHRRDLC
jgi:hypothetical protein